MDTEGTETWIKICGVQFPDNAREIAQLDINALGINRYSESSRYCSIDQARSIRHAVRSVDPSIKLVGVFVDRDPERVEQELSQVDYDVLQLHGDESPREVEQLNELRPTMKGIRLPPDDPVDWEQYSCWSLLFDHYDPEQVGGTGQQAPWDRLEEMELPDRWVLAGGLDVTSVGDAIDRLDPWGVDICSGVETTQGLKHPDQVSDLVRQVRGDFPQSRTAG